MLKTRIMTAVLGIPIVLVCLVLGDIYLQALVFLMVLAGLIEFARLISPHAMLDYLLVSGLSFVLLSYSGIDGTKLIIWLIGQTFYYLIRCTFAENTSLKRSSNLLGVMYIAIPFTFLWMVRNNFGLTWVLFGLAIIWITDTAAYLGGTKFGRHKLAPSISPNKSIEGAIIGTVAGSGGGILFAYYAGKPLLFAVLLAISLSISGQIGDLIESGLKRERSIKDSGSLLPGHGGILDRFDSLAFVFPLLFIALSLYYSSGL